MTCSWKFSATCIATTRRDPCAHGSLRSRFALPPTTDDSLGTGSRCKRCKRNTSERRRSLPPTTSWLRALIATSLESIDIARRGVFILHELDAQPMVEIAQALGIPVNTAYSRLRVAREEFTATFRLLAAR
jgi:hypothetical protein